MPSEQEFRESLRNFRLGSTSNNNNTRTSTNENTTPFSKLVENTSSLFGSIGNRVQGYVPLTNNTQQEDDWFTLTRWQRLVGFGLCLAFGIFCFLIAFLTIPILVINPRKFAVTYTMGSLFIMASFAFLNGPLAHLKHIFSVQRLPFTFAYIVSMVATLYFALVLHSYLFTIIFSVIQVAALLWYIVSYFPGGVSSLQFGTRMVANQASSILPI